MPCYAGGIDLDLPLDELLRQTDGNLAKGFRAIKMKVGRKRLSEDVEARAGDARASRRGLPADGGRQHEMDASTRRSAPRAPSSPSISLGWRSRPSPTIRPATPASCARAGLPIAAGENLRTLWEFKQLYRGGGVTYPEPDVTNCGGVTPFMKIAHLAEAFNLPVTIARRP